MKRKHLTPENKKQIRYQMRAGFVFSIGVIVVGFFAYFVSSLLKEIIPFNPIILIPSSLFLGLLIFWTTNRKYLIDLKNGEKIIKHAKISRKESHTSYEAGSSAGISFGSGKENNFYKGMNPNQVYSFIIDSYRYKVEYEMWENAKEGESIEMHYLPVKNELLEIKLIENKNRG